MQLDFNDSILAQFQGIAATKTEVDLSYNDLGSKNNDEIKRLCEGLAAMPASATTLRLGFNKCYNISTENLIRILKAIPAWVTELDLSYNDLAFSKDIFELNRILSAIPLSVKTVNLGNNHFWKLHKNELAYIFSGLHTEMTSLDISGNKFYQMKHNNIEHITTLANRARLYLKNFFHKKNNLPIQGHNLTLQKLSLKFNNLGDSKADELARFLLRLSETSTEIDLGFNRLYRLESRLALIFANLPPPAAILNLKYNALYLMATADLISSFCNIPQSVTFLGLRGNFLAKWRRPSHLASILAAIPANVTHLDLSLNDIGLMDIEDIRQVLAAIPATVSTLYFNFGDFRRMSAANRAEFFAAIPDTVTTLNINGNCFSRYESIELNLNLMGFSGETQETSYQDMLKLSEKMDRQDYENQITKYLSQHPALETRLKNNSYLKKLNLASDKFIEAMEIYSGTKMQSSDAMRDIEIDFPRAYQLFSEIPEWAGENFAEAQLWMAKIICNHSSLTPENFKTETAEDKAARLYKMQPYINAAAAAGLDIAQFEKSKMDAELAKLPAKIPDAEPLAAKVSAMGIFSFDLPAGGNSEPGVNLRAEENEGYRRSRRMR